MKRLSAFLFMLILIPLSSAWAFTVGVISDVNGTECQPKYPSNSLQAIQRLLSEKPLDHVIFSGDAVHGECLRYEGETPYSDVVQSMWQEFDRNFFRPTLAATGLGLVLAPGNHDAPLITGSTRDTFKIENQGFKAYWKNIENFLGVARLKIPGIDDGYPYYWAYVHREVLFIVLYSSTSGSLSNGVQQKKWLRALFNSAPSRKARARIAIGHVPPYPVLDPSVGPKYSAFLHKEQVGKPHGLMDLLIDGGVGLLIVGHSHAPFPAELTRQSDDKKIMILSMPCTHASRKLFSQDKVSLRGYALIDISQEGRVSLAIRDARTGAALPLESFPSQIPLNDSAVKYERIPRALYR